jgi:hypothetical protein
MRPALKRSHIDPKLLLDIDRKSYMGHLNHVSDLTLRWPFKFSTQFGLMVNIEYLRNGLSQRVQICCGSTRGQTQCNHLFWLSKMAADHHLGFFGSQCHSSRLMRHRETHGYYWTLIGSHIWAIQIIYHIWPWADLSSSVAILDRSILNISGTFELEGSNVVRRYVLMSTVLSYIYFEYRRCRSAPCCIIQSQTQWCRLMCPVEMATRTVVTFKDQWLIDQFLVYICLLLHAWPLNSGSFRKKHLQILKYISKNSTQCLIFWCT